MSHTTTVGRTEEYLVVTKDDECCWLEDEILIASDTWENVEEMR